MDFVALQEQMRKLNLTAAALAGLLGVTRHAVHHWLAGRRKVPQAAQTVLRLLAEQARQQDRLRREKVKARMYRQMYQHMEHENIRQVRRTMRSAERELREAVRVLVMMRRGCGQLVLDAGTRSGELIRQAAGQLQRAGELLAAMTERAPAGEGQASSPQIMRLELAMMELARELESRLNGRLAALQEAFTAAKR